MSKFSKLDQLLENFAQHSVPGCACVVMQENEIIYEGYKGYADIDNQQKVHAGSIFRQASTTKLMTYVILGMLYEEGQFLLSDPIGEYLPEWKKMHKFVNLGENKVDIVPLENPITIKDVVTMACGLPYCMFPEPESKEPVVAAMSQALLGLIESQQPLTLRNEVRAMAKVPVLFEPGTQWLYGYGSEITGAILEEITGKSLRYLFQERLIEPLGLKATGTFYNQINKKDIVGNYEKNHDGKFIKLPETMDAMFDPVVTHEGARVNLLASAADYGKFMQMLALGGAFEGHKYLSRKTVSLLATNYLNEAQLKDFHSTYLAGYGYGLGFRVLMDKAAGNHNGSLGAFGWTGGSGIWVEADPKERLSIVYMHNMRPNEELYHHLRVRNVTYGCLD